MENYEEKLKLAEELYNKVRWMSSPEARETSITLEKIFHELKESEDERIRKELISFLEGFYANKNKDKWIAWLEKQKDIIEKYEDKLDRCACESWDKGYKEGKRECEWNEEDADMVKETIYFINEFQKSNRCKDENDMQNSVTCENWLKSLKDRVQPQQKQEWSEEDERIRQCLIKDQEKSLDEVRNDKYGHSEIISDLKEIYRERIDWLKSLKPKSHWKPSEEEMAALLYALGRGGTYNHEALTKLYNDLKTF